MGSNTNVTIAREKVDSSLEEMLTQFLTILGYNGNVTQKSKDDVYGGGKLFEKYQNLSSENQLKVVKNIWLARKKGDISFLEKCFIGNISLKNWLEEELPKNYLN